MKSITTALGPFDRRAQRTRCLECALGHLKCVGGMPCYSCRRKHRICKFSEPARPAIRLDDAIRFGSNERRTRSDIQTASAIIYPVILDLDTKYIAYFAESFLPCNSLTGSSLADFDDVRSMLQSSEGLQNAAIAISVLNLPQSVNSSRKAVALRHYRAAISSVRAEVADGVTSQNIPMLWNTFFLGIFELMYDSSGEGWLKHILHGTSQLLQIRGPEQHFTGQGRRFFLVVRIFEITRALIFWSPTFLAQEHWRALMSKMWIGEFANEWHPKEDLLDLMVSCSDVGIRAMHLIQTSEHFAEPADEVTLRQLANECMDLQAALRAWEASARSWSAASFPTVTLDPQMTLALIYFNATLIYLSGIFDYHHTHWTSLLIPTPILAVTEVHERVNTILDMVDQALKQTNLTSLSFLFPLRVAGSRAKSVYQRAEISRMLGEINCRGFVVADAFSIDLVALWRRLQPAAQSTPNSGTVRPHVKTLTMYRHGPLPSSSEHQPGNSKEGALVP